MIASVKIPVLFQLLRNWINIRNKLFLPRLVRGFDFVSTKAVLVKKSRQTFEGAQTKGSLVQRELTPKAAEGVFYDEILFLQSLRLACASYLPLHKGGSLPPDGTSKRYNILYLARQGVWKGVRTNCSYSFCCRAGGHLPPLSWILSRVFGGSKPPPYAFVGR